MMVVPWVLLLVVIVVAAGMICCWLKSNKKGQCTTEQSRSHLLTVDQTGLANKGREQVKESDAVEVKDSVYDEVKPNCAETAISLKSNIAYTTVNHTSVL